VIPDFTDLSILIVEDDEASLFLFKELLEPTGANLFYARCEEDFFEHLDKYEFRIILLDIRLGNASGFDLLPHIRKKLPNAIVIAQTAYVLPDESEMFMMEGFDGYISKPLHMAKLYNLISSFLS
jgi:two-component system, cell cycle response regulator DivK